ncbi:MAG: TIR domain-containing protein [Bernardetiaceae bacterium]
MSDFKDVFISYGRAESKAFATKIHDWLRAEDYAVWFDQNDIPLAVDFQTQIDQGIQEAHNFIFIIAPHALRSVYCLKEILQAIRLGKRIIPILHIEPQQKEDWDQMHPTISKLNWLYFRQQYDPNLPLEQWEDIDDFARAFDALKAVLQSNQEYVAWHTYILNEAIRWNQNQRRPQFLLAGDDREQALKWLLTDFRKEQTPCLPTDLQCEYICESRKNAENLMADVFISSPPADRRLREQITAALHRKSITTWTEADIKTGQRARDAAKTGILHSDNFIFFLSTESVVSVECLKELKTAIKNQKRIIPLLVEFVDDYQIPRSVRSLKRVDFTDNENEEHFQIDIRDLIQEIRKDQTYYHQHKILLARALKWEQQNRNDSILLQGQSLQEAQAWLDIGERRADHKPTQLHRDFIQESLLKTGQIRTDVFLCYASNEGDFVRRLNEELQIHGKNTWFDQETINTNSSEGFRQEVEQAILESDNVVFILSKKSVENTDTQAELAHAQTLGKRIITLIYDEVPPWQMPDRLRQTTQIDFERDKMDFHDAFSQLIRQLDADSDHVRSHTRWEQEARQWSQNGQNEDFLLRGSEFTIAKEWLEDAKRRNKKPAPTPLQESFIAKSEEVIEWTRQQEEAQERRLLDLERARVREAQKRVRRQNISLVIISVALLVAIVFGSIAYKRTTEASAALAIAEEAEKLARLKTEETERALQKSLEAEISLQNALIEVETARANAEAALQKAGIAISQRQQAVRERVQVERQAKSRLSAQEQREIEKFQELRKKLEQAQKDLQRAVDDMAAIGVIRPAVKQRLRELIEKEFKEATVE